MSQSQITPGDAYVRARLIVRLLLENPATDPSFSEGLALGMALSALELAEEDVPPEEAQPSLLPGAITNTDIKRFASAFFGLDVSTQDHLVKDLDAAIVSVADYFYCDEDVDQDGRVGRAWSLPEALLGHIDRLSDDEKAGARSREEIINLVTEINQVHPDLEKQLNMALRTLPQVLHASRLIHNDLAATSIETALARLALMRAKAHRSLYGHSPAGAASNVADALASAHQKLQADAARMEAEEARLDQQLSEYERLLKLVDGNGSNEPSGGFSQVVEDWIRIQKESDECRRDLRRLGWTEQ